MAKPDWIIKQAQAASRAGKVSNPSEFAQVRQGVIMSRRMLWETQNPIPLVRWANDVQIVVLDGSPKLKGTLMLLKGNVAAEVRTSPEVLLKVYRSHQELRWWRGQTLHRCAPVKQAS